MLRKHQQTPPNTPKKNMICNPHLEGQTTLFQFDCESSHVGMYPSVGDCAVCSPDVEGARDRYSVDSIINSKYLKPAPSSRCRGWAPNWFFRRKSVYWLGRDEHQNGFERRRSPKETQPAEDYFVSTLLAVGGCERLNTRFDAKFRPSLLEGSLVLADAQGTLFPRLLTWTNSCTLNEVLTRNTNA